MVFFLGPIFYLFLFFDSFTYGLPFQSGTCIASPSELDGAMEYTLDNGTSTTLWSIASSSEFVIEVLHLLQLSYYEAGTAIQILIRNTIDDTGFRGFLLYGTDGNGTQIEGFTNLNENSTQFHPLCNTSITHVTSSLGNDLYAFNETFDFTIPDDINVGETITFYAIVYQTNTGIADGIFHFPDPVTIEISGPPSLAPSAQPTQLPSQFPSFFPISSPTIVSVNPSKSPTNEPTLFPSSNPTRETTGSPTFVPSSNPTSFPSESSLETISPSTAPTVNPSSAPSSTPLLTPSLAPSSAPLLTPSEAPSLAPSTLSYPTLEPTKIPTLEPTQTPTPAPTETISVTIENLNSNPIENDTLSVVLTGLLSTSLELFADFINYTNFSVDSSTADYLSLNSTNVFLFSALKESYSNVITTYNISFNLHHLENITISFVLDSDSRRRRLSTLNDEFIVNLFFVIESTILDSSSYDINQSIISLYSILTHNITSPNFRNEFISLLGFNSTSTELTFIDVIVNTLDGQMIDIESYVVSSEGTDGGSGGGGNKNDLNDGEIAAIVICVVVAVFACIAIGIYFWKRDRKEKEKGKYEKPKVVGPSGGKASEIHKDDAERAHLTQNDDDSNL